MSLGVLSVEANREGARRWTLTLMLLSCSLYVSSRLDPIPINGEMFQIPTAHRCDSPFGRPCMSNITDLQRTISDVLLGEDYGSPVHSRVFAQVNSGCNVWIIEDMSAVGTQVYDSNGAGLGLKPVNLLKNILAVQGRWKLRVGPYIFECHQPSDETEIQERDRWFRRHEAIPVTRQMMDDQLAGQMARWKTLKIIGEGASGNVTKVMERHTGLMVAIKTQIVSEDRDVRREINNMKALAHVVCQAKLKIDYCIADGSSPSWYNTLEATHSKVPEESSGRLLCLSFMVTF